MVAMLVAARFPEAVSRLVLVSTTPKFVASDDFPAGLPLVLLRRLEKRIKIEGITAFHRLVFPGGQQTGLADLSIDRALQELAALEKVDLRPLLPLIKAPTVIIHGDRDEICLPAAAEYLQKNIRGSELVLLPAVGHAPLAELERYVR
jgi:pimeloyl-[acyl-carrier protein] methyl ester esterase